MSQALVVTGGSRGIGHSVCLGAVADGWSVCVNYVINKSRADETVAEIEAAGGKAVAVQADIAKEEDVVRLFDTCEKELGPVRGAVNNAGIVEPYGRLEDLNYQELLPLIDINVNAAIIVSREAVRRMSTNQGRKGGSIVLVSSVSSRLGSPNFCVPYAASKGAVDVLGWGLAQEVASEGIRVNVVSPGLIDTEIQPAGRIENDGPKLPAGRAGKPEEVAKAILWLLSDEASYVSGSNLAVSFAR